jgi:hypothetical protein
MSAHLLHLTSLVVQILAFTDGQDQEEDDEMTAAAVHDIRALLECIDGALAAGHSFEYCQALLQLVLQVRMRRWHEGHTWLHMACSHQTGNHMLHDVMQDLVHGVHGAW